MRDYQIQKKYYYGINIRIHNLKSSFDLDIILRIHMHRQHPLPLPLDFYMMSILTPKPT